MTVSTPRRVSLAWEVSSRNSDSGVVMRMSGGLAGQLPRSSAAVSPVRTATAMSRLAQAEPVRGVPDPGQRGAQVPLDVHGQRLERGDVEHPGAPFRVGGRRRRASLSIAHKNAASVLPEPVGATTSVSSPLPIARHAPAWACVGSANAPSNHARVAGENPSRGSSPVTDEFLAIPPYCLAPPTFLAGALQ